MDEYVVVSPSFYANDFLISITTPFCPFLQELSWPWLLPIFDLNFSNNSSPELITISLKISQREPLLTPTLHFIHSLHKCTAFKFICSSAFQASLAVVLQWGSESSLLASRLVGSPYIWPASHLPVLLPGAHERSTSSLTPEVTDAFVQSTVKPLSLFFPPKFNDTIHAYESF